MVFPPLPLMHMHPKAVAPLGKFGCNPTASHPHWVGIAPGGGNFGILAGGEGVKVG